MSMVLDILEGLWETKLYYKGLCVNMFGIPRTNNRDSNSLRSTLSQLRKKGYVNNQNNFWSITKSGRKYLKFKANNIYLEKFDFKFEKESRKNLIVMFDVVESRKQEREWLRWHLKKFNYLMIQKSVWVGPSPLPKQFLNYLKEIDLLSSIKTFKLARPYRI